MATNLMSNAMGILCSSAQVPTATAMGTNAAATYAAFSFSPSGNKTLNAVRVYVSTVNGAPASGDIVADLWAANAGNGQPYSLSQIETGKLPTATISAPGYYDFNGFTTALTANTLYWIVFRNLNATPASINVQFRYVSGLVTGLQGGTGLFAGAWAAGSSSNSGSNWSVNTGRVGIRVAYSDGTYDGFPVNNVAAAGVGVGIYGAREAGMVFTSPPHTALRVSGVGIYLNGRTGTPSGLFRVGLWTGSTPINLGYASIPGAGSGVSGMVSGFFSSSVIIPPNTTVRVTGGEESNADASTARYNLLQCDYNATANSIALLPFQGTPNTTYFDGSGWTQGTLGQTFYPFAVILDSADPFANAVGPGSRNRFIGGGIF